MSGVGKYAISQCPPAEPQGGRPLLEVDKSPPQFKPLCEHKLWLSVESVFCRREAKSFGFLPVEYNVGKHLLWMFLSTKCVCGAYVCVVVSVCVFVCVRVRVRACARAHAHV